ncbi:unnamed protein product [Allacma fusca]|uniref:Globin domain-containing protein n=1 Tax=Allacma fusca TaxID=39272 RepID=A0A8J2NZE8_9HEXA|nr:unnamed protein product [Allacma fusca]
MNHEQVHVHNSYQLAFDGLANPFIVQSSVFFQIPGLKMSNQPNADLIPTAEENQALLDTWGIIAKDLKGYGSKFFIHFFKQYPHYQLQFKAFAKVPLEELPENRRFKAHALTLMSALNGFIENLDDVEMLDELLLKMGENHAKRKLTREDFVRVQDSLQEFIALELGTLYTAPVKTGWKKILAVMTDRIGEGIDNFNSYSD